MNSMPKEVKAAPHRSSISTASAAGGSGRSSASWSPKDDETLIGARAAGLNWNQIAPRYFSSKTPNACRKRHERLMERKNAEEWDGVKLEELATAYMEVREQMWRILAERVNEKWGLVEQKCMEKGFKNLQQAYRSALKKQSGHHDDSGFYPSDPDDDLDDHRRPPPVQDPTTMTYQAYNVNVSPRSSLPVSSLLSGGPVGPQSAFPPVPYQH